METLNSLTGWQHNLVKGPRVSMAMYWWIGYAFVGTTVIAASTVGGFALKRKRMYMGKII